MAGILVYALHDDDGEFNKNSLGAISEAAKLAGEIGGDAAALVVGDVSDDAAAALGNHGAKRVLVERPVVVQRVDQDGTHASSFLSSSHDTICSTVSFVSSSSMILPGSFAAGALKSAQCARALS